MMAVTGFNHWGKVAKSLKPAAQQVVTKTAVAIEKSAEGGAPKDTGFLSSSAYSVTPNNGSTYGDAMSPPGDSYLLPEEKPPNDTAAIAGVAANYGPYVNYGHHTRSGTYVPAQPFWEPAIEVGKTVLDDELAKMGGKLGGSIT